MSSHPARPMQPGDRISQQPQPPKAAVRQPLSVKNTMSPTAVLHQTEEVAMASVDILPSKTHQSTTQLFTSVRSRNPGPASITTPKLTTSTHSNIATIPTNQRFYNSHHPSPLAAEAGAARNIGSDEEDNEDGGADSSSSRKARTHLSPSVVKTPKKRAIPLEDVHVRNAGAGQRQDDGDSQSPNPSKRSRSSKDSSATDPSTSTSLSIATGFGDVNLRSQGHVAGQGSAVVRPAPPPMPSHSTVSRAGFARQPLSRPPTTTRIDKQSRMTENDRLQRERQKAETQKEWRRKYMKVFPTFHFHLDGLDEWTRVEVTKNIEKLGACIEPFFSNSVTHLVTTRKVPAGVIQEAQTGPLPTELLRPQKAEALARMSTTVAGANSSRPLAGSSRLSRLPALRKRNNDVPLHSDKNPFEERGPPLPANDILNKARDFGIKVWTLDKFRSVMTSLVGSEHQVDAQKQPNLTQMLEKEKVQGTLEKDPLVARDNFHYFSKGSVYILIEDATGEHRPIMVQEWRKPVYEDEEIPWPVLHGELEGRCPFTKFDFEGDVRKRMKPNRHETLKRSVSLSQLQRRGLAMSPVPQMDSRYSINRGASPYPLASGNSISIASNIASTTSTAVGGGPSGLGLIPPYGALGRKVNQATGIGIGRPSTTPVNRSPRNSTAPVGGINEQPRGALVRRMLGMTGEGKLTQAGMRRSVSTASAGQHLRREKKPGYCENCRVKYEDFDEHIVGRKHRKFAEDDRQFTDIDAMLARVCRPIAAWAMEACTPGPEDEHERSSTSSLLAAGGSLLEAEHAASQPGKQSHELSQQSLTSPRSFRDAMKQWQQSTQSVTMSPRHHNLHISPHQPPRLLMREVGGVDEGVEEDSTSSHGAAPSLLAAANSTRQADGQQTEEDSALASPDTSPHIHRQYEHDLVHESHHHDDHDAKHDPESFYGNAL